MDNNKTYIQILISTLTKKNNILNELIRATNIQKEYLSAQTLDIDSFDKIVDEKEAYIRQLNELDEGFDTVYERVRQDLAVSKKLFQTEITILQDLIRQITEKSVKLRSLEQQNKISFDIFSGNKKKEIKAYKMNTQSVSNYYKNMSGQNVGESYFLDKKK